MNIPGRSYLVGGAVRDELLGLPGGDRDWVVVGATPEAMQQAGFTQVGRDFPVFLHPTTHEEYALARTERKTGQGHLGFECHAGPEVTLEEDLLRRDLTINAIAQEPDGTLVDPYGGQKDLLQMQLRHVSDAFSEDPLRVLRVARFKARFGFDIAPETTELMQSMVANDALAELSAERVWQEFAKALRYPAAVDFINTLTEIDALQPWFAECAALPANFRFVGATALQRYGSLAALLGGEPMRSLGKRIIAPGQYLRMADAVTQQGALLCTWQDAKAGELLTGLQQLGVLQKSASGRLLEFVELLLVLVELNPGTEQIGDGRRLRLLINELTTIGAAAVADERLEGPEIGAAITRLRESAVRSAQKKEKKKAAAQEKAAKKGKAKEKGRGKEKGKGKEKEKQAGRKKAVSYTHSPSPRDRG